MYVIDKNKNLKCLRRKEEKQQIVDLKDESDREIRNRNEIIEMTKQYYENLYNTQIERPRTSTDTKVLNVGSEDTPEINEEESLFALKTLKNNKSLREDNILTEMIEEAHDMIVPELKNLFNECSEQQITPDNWNNPIIQEEFQYVRSLTE
ncbi:hypothetical protein HHI36_006881 [Cryptolaemus montrouzieri]|uniref:Uncharacterized protein n=1 Tax=Cryptolaemus montrouzieri TaxID=559131 RepID=A0ABD2MND1_9CUCU